MEGGRWREGKGREEGREDEWGGGKVNGGREDEGGGCGPGLRRYSSSCVVTSFSWCLRCVDLSSCPRFVSSLSCRGPVLSSSRAHRLSWACHIVTMVVVVWCGCRGCGVVWSSWLWCGVVIVVVVWCGHRGCGVVWSCSGGMVLVFMR